MVCQAASGMTTAHAREVVSTCNNSMSRLQAVADMLLLSSDLRPIAADSLAGHGESYDMCKDTVVARTKGLLMLTGRMHEFVYSVSAKWQDVCSSIQDICELVVGLTECCAHSVYLLAISYPSTTVSVPGLIDPYKVRRCSLDLDLSCQKLKQAGREHLHPPLLVQVCSDISNNLSTLTDCCKYASEQEGDSCSQEQFRLCIKSITSCGSCLLASIKCFKRQPTPTHYQRCIVFCDPLLASTKSVVSFATEEQFIGSAAVTSPDVRDKTKGVMGACMSIVSSCVQLCRVIKDLAYNNSNKQLRDRVGLCIEAISKSSAQLADALTRQAATDEKTRP